MSRFGFAALCGLFVMVPALSCAGDLAPVALNSLSTVPPLNATQVQDQKGHLLGQAERIQADQDGKPSALAFRAINGSTVIIAAPAVSYDGHILTVASDEPQIAALTQPQRTAAAR
ncbi:MAG TPA: hypothetical protein VJ753_05780 [Rhizomicrobium sp.]|nr:hypothetical protein [Rhizomicrobium sp.]